MDKKEAKDLKKKLRKIPHRKLDGMMHEAHDKAFACTECLECANCCSSISPTFTDKDISRISGKLRMKQQGFIEQFLREDEDGDMVLQSVPCPFLGEGNYCDIYDFRPKACRGDPHTDRARQGQILDLTFKNAEVCPAVEKILTNLEHQVR